MKQPVLWTSWHLCYFEIYNIKPELSVNTPGHFLKINIENQKVNQKLRFMANEINKRLNRANMIGAQIVCSSLF